MNRCLHINIHEDSSSASRRARSGLPGRRETDPGTDYYMPKPDDPGTDYYMPKPDDPGTDYYMPKPDDPSSGPWVFGGGGGAGTGCGCGAVVATACCCGCAPTGPSAATPGTTAPNPFVTARDYSGFVIVRLAPGIESETAPTLWHLADGKKLTGLKTVLEKPGETDLGARQVVSPPATVPPPATDPSGGGAATGRTSKSDKGGDLIPTEPKPLPPLPEGALFSAPLVELKDLKRKDCVERIHALENTAALSPFPPLHSLVAYWRVDLRELPGFVEGVVERLNRLAEVDLAYRELVAADPEQDGRTAEGQVFAEDQGYLEDAPVGISAAWAWKRLPAGAAKVTVCDLEQGWNPGHTDLQLPRPLPVYGTNRLDEGGPTHHGTAVLGQLAATGQSSFGVKGAAADLGNFVLTSHYKDGHNGNVAAAIIQTLSPILPPLSPPPLSPLQEGDVLLLEVQRGLLPTEVDEADLDAIRLASGLGVIVVEAAGNGGFDLDAWSDPDTGRRLLRGAHGFRDSGAILVGASRAALPHDRAPFSNYGSRLDCFGWGETVTTCGYGDLAGTGDADLYTNTFSGTSSASPIIAGAAALLQSLHEDRASKRLDPRAMRTLLGDPATGTRQGPNMPGYIGVMPDLRAIIRDRLQLVPDVYLRRPSEDEAGASPDIRIAADQVFIALRNRGLGDGEAHVQLFASPVATLITPERWIPVSTTGLDVSPIPQGDLPVETAAFTWQPPGATQRKSRGTPSGGRSDGARLVDPGDSTFPVTTPWSFLAVLSPEAPSPLGPPYFPWATGLPPGPPYFDWAVFRAFLRKPEVAWRNVYWVPPASTSLPFFIAGTPEKAHVFDFEVIQRLPARASVSLHVPAALHAKLRQRQPWLGGAPGPLALPARPRLAIRGVELAAGTYAAATFTVQATGLQPGHSLAIRQLWRGEVVGGITWFFGPEP